MSSIIYADVGSTVPMHTAAVEAWTKSVGQGHPLYASAKVAEQTEKTLARFQRAFEKECNLAHEEFRLIFTSGAAEANTLMVHSCVRAAFLKNRKRAHVVIGAGEDESIHSAARQLASVGLCTFSYAPVELTGAVAAESLEAVMRPNTCLVSITASDSLTGSMADLRKLGNHCWVVGESAQGKPERRRVPFHSDVTHLFALSSISPNDLNLDAFSVSAHHFGGPVGFGILAVRESLVRGYGLRSLISGRILNAPALVATKAAFRVMHDDRSRKNQELLWYTSAIEKVLRGSFEVFDYPSNPPPDLVKCERASKAMVKSQREINAALAEEPYLPPVPQIIMLGAPSAKRLPNTVAFAVRGPRSVTASEMQKALEAKNVICRVFDGQQLEDRRIPGSLRCIVRLTLIDDLSKKLAKALALALDTTVKAVTQAA